MEIDDPSTLDVVSKENSDIPISEFVLLEDEITFLYQTIMNWREGGNFLYDTVWFDRTTREEGERLYINEAVMNAMLNEKETWLYYVKMSRKTDQTNQYDLYRFDLTGGREEEKVNIEEALKKHYKNIDTGSKECLTCLWEFFSILSIKTVYYSLAFTPLFPI